MSTTDLLIQRLAAALVNEVLTDPEDFRLFLDWLRLYHAQAQREASK